LATILNNCLQQAATLTGMSPTTFFHAPHPVARGGKDCPAKIKPEMRSLVQKLVREAGIPALSVARVP
jgi:hypothetical protein